MKIAFLNIYQYTVKRGAETFVRELSKRLSKKYDVTVFGGYKLPAKRWPILWRAFIDPHGVQVCWWTIKKLSQIWREKYDVVIPLNGGWQPAFIRLITWLYGGKMVISGHSGRGWDDRNNLWSFPNVFAALSRPAKRWAKRANPFLKRVVHIPNGIDLNLFSGKGRKAEIELARPIILAVSAPEKGKRLTLAIDAVSKLGRGSLLILGGGYGEKKLRSFGRELLGKKFLMKSIHYEKIPEYYRAADVFTLPSWEHEAFGMVYLEAMASGLPVVSTDDELRRDIVGNAGILVDVTDIEVYAKALDKALKTDWGDKPRKQAEKFSWDKVVEQYEKLFESLNK